MSKDMFPNSTQVPNIILGEWMPILSGSEFKIICLLARQTIGYELDKGTGRRKDRDWMNIGQIKKRTGIRSAQTISKSIGILSEKHRLIETVTESGFLLDSPEKREKHSGKIYYRLVIKKPCANVVEKL